MPRSAVAYLAEMDETCQFLIERTAAMTLDEYLQDKTVRLAVERCFITLGEAMNQLHRHHPVIGSVFMDRPGMVAFRNVIVHEYWAVDSEDVWSTLISKVPPLKVEIERAIQSIQGQ
jgi:uncharacterized protein with HEPN domain